MTKGYFRRRNRDGFTLLELLLVVGIIVILGSAILSLFGGGFGGGFSDPETGQSYYSMENTGVFTCVNTYPVTSGESTSKRVNLEPDGGGSVVTMTCDDDFRSGINNSATIYAQFSPGKKYSVTYVGFRRESTWNAQFPNVKSVALIPQ